ncbi:unnamed protein product, partial [Ectocarpus sp. 8 AP-2014]
VTSKSAQSCCAYHTSGSIGVLNVEVLLVSVWWLVLALPIHPDMFVLPMTAVDPYFGCEGGIRVVPDSHAAAKRAFTTSYLYFVPTLEQEHVLEFWQGVGLELPQELQSRWRAKVWAPESDRKRVTTVRMKT